ncbi:Secretory Carrier-Associated Membrane Protein 4 [Manis pentadactyla]|nr:Secretory Carrier-Associated Membrane Protein 4 [Manis pentadactyla]
MVDQGYCEGKAMRMIRLRRELGVNSDVMAKVIYRLKVKTCFLVGINIEDIGITNELQDYGGRMTDVDDDGGGSLKDARAREDVTVGDLPSESGSGMLSKTCVSNELCCQIEQEPGPSLELGELG